MKSAREALIRGGPAAVERALTRDARPVIEAGLRDPRWLPPPPPFGDDAVAAAAAAAAGTYAPPVDEAEAYEFWEAPVRRLRLAREACTALGIGAGRDHGPVRPGHGGGEGSEQNKGGGDDDHGQGGVPLALAASLYEASADAAAAMRCADGELIKALAGLCGSIYPALRRELAGADASQRRRQDREEEEQQQPPQQQPREGAPGRPPPPPSSPPPPPPRLLLAREAEMRAALVLFYACMPARPLPQSLAQCLSIQPASFLGRDEQGEEGEEAAGPMATAATASAVTAAERRLVRAAVRGAAAALSGDWVAFGACYARMPRVPRHVMARCLPRARLAAVRCMARAFAPSLPVACCERWLGLRCARGGAQGRGKEGRGADRHAPLVALLEEAAAAGCRGSAAALAAREAARRARADAAWDEEGGAGVGGAGGAGGQGDRAWDEEGGGDDGDDDVFSELVFKPPPTALARRPAAPAAPSAPS